MEGSEILIIIIFFSWIKRVNRKDDSNYYLPSQELFAIEEELANNSSYQCPGCFENADFLERTP